MLVMLIILGCSFLFLCLTLIHRFLSPGSKVYTLTVILIFFLAVEWAMAQDGTIRQAFQALEAVALVILAIYAFCNRGAIPTQYGRVMGYVLTALIFFNFAACITAYDSIEVFVWSTYDTCKYFAVLFAVMAMGLKKDDLRSFCVLVALLITICFALSLVQFLGVEELYNPFLGKYEIRYRSGAYRAIGFFPYPIELGNWAAMMFAFVYGVNRGAVKSRAMSVVCILCVLMTAFSGTRTSIAVVIAVYVFTNLHSFKNFGKAVLIGLVMALCLSSFMPWGEILTRLNLDISEDLPRQYYLIKGLEVWSDYPLFGIGYGTYGASRYRSMTQDYIFNAYGIHQYDSANLASTDSFLSEVIPEYGLVGLSVIGVLIFSLVKAAKASRQASIMCTPALIAGAMLAANSSSVFSSPHIGFLFWLVAGLLFSVSAALPSPLPDSPAERDGRH